MVRTVLLILATLAGCAARPAVPTNTESLGAQLKKQDGDLVGQQFRTLLDFENASDAVFVRAGSIAPSGGHTGSNSVHVNASGVVRISPLLFGASLPGDWTLLGGYVRPQIAGVVNVALVADGQVISRSSRFVPAATWAFAGIDLTDPAYAAPLASAKSIELAFTQAAGFDLDDLMLVNNRRTLVDWPGVWSIERRGFELNVNVNSRPARRFVLAAADEHGVDIEELNPLRLRLRDATGKAITLLPDGRVLPADRTGDEAGQISVADGAGTVNRDSPGDLNNDGYNESQGAYQISANASRLSVRLTPGRSPIDWPLIEVHHLPPESDTVTANGRLIDRTTRLPNGALLILLPMRIDQPTEVTIGVSGR